MRKNSISLQEWCLKNEKEFLLKEWDYSKNDFSPCEVSRASKKKAYWICFCCGSNYLMSIQNRTLNGAKCQKCSRKEAHEKERKRRIKETGSLAEKRPDILEKWDYEKNKKISPYEVSPKSTINVWWKCQICGYEFQSRVIDVRSSKGCIKCRGNKYIHIGKDGKYTIYCHICPDNKRYIGMTASPLKIRFGNGVHYSRTTRFGKAIEKFGYNMTNGGANGGIFGRTLSEETETKISNSNKGKQRSLETRERLRKSHIGKESHNVRGVIKLDLCGNILDEYVSISDAVRKNENVDRSSIWKSCTGRRKTAGGYIWKYK